MESIVLNGWARIALNFKTKDCFLGRGEGVILNIRSKKFGAIVLIAIWLFTIYGYLIGKNSLFGLIVITVCAIPMSIVFWIEGSDLIIKKNHETNRGGE